MKPYFDYDIPILNTNGLPSYPIPNMEDTFKHFLEWVEPLISEEDYIEASNLVNVFLESDDSKKIHKKVHQLGSKDNDSWIFDSWLKTYLKSREPFVPYTNVPIVYENSTLENFTPIKKAAALIYGVANTYLHFRKNDNGEYYVGKKRYSSDQFHGTLGSINHIQRVMNQYYINSGFSTNIVILYKNNIYSLDIMDDTNKVYDVSYIYNAVKSIYKQSIDPIFPNINFVTAEPDQDIAGDYLAQILKDPKNNDNYQKIKDSIFILNLDEDNPETPLEELYSTCMDTSSFNRWHGKGLEFSISENGVISFVMDHSFCDASTSVYLIDKLNFFMKDIVFTGVKDTISYEELRFNLDDDLSLKLIQSFEDYKTVMNSFTPRYVDLEGLSRTELRENGILSGDGFFHIALQSAQQMTFDNIYNTYIAVDMRQYFRGRTEANRPVTIESLKFVKELLNPQTDTLNQKKLLLEALDAHYHRTLLCTTGKGVNRYLYILEEVYRDFKDELNILQRPAIFDSLAYKTIGYNKLSTTSFGHKNLKYSYFPPVVKGGLGIYYVISNKSFAIITSFNEDVDNMNEFNKNLKHCIDKMLVIASDKSQLR